MKERAHAQEQGTFAVRCEMATSTAAGRSIAIMGPGNALPKMRLALSDWHAQSRL